MSIERTSVVGLLASLAMIAGQARGQDFNQRYAAWQGRSAVTQPMAPSSMPPPETGGEAEVLPPSPGGNSQRLLSGAYSAPLHTPDYNRPWTTSGCASCSHNPGYVPASDPLGTCDFGGGDGGYGGCGPNGCFGGGPCGACGGAGGGCDWGPLCSNSLVWAKFDVLLMWRQGRDFPPIVTTDPTTESSTTAGILPDANTIFGGGRVGANMQAGGRLDLGFFTNPTQTVGFGDRVFGLGKDASNFNVSSNNVPVLAIPFRDFSTGNNDALLVAYPGLRSGSINVASTSSVFGNDVYARFLLCRDCNHRFDFITGWNYTRVADEAQIGSRSTVTEVGGTIPTGTVRTTLDQFTAHNDFNGGILGLQWQRDCGVWSTQVLTRMSLGNMHETLIVNGSTQIAVPNQTPTTTSGGLFSAASNIGSSSRNEFTAITELGFNLAYRFSPSMQMRIGYTLLYWNDVLRPANSINTNIGANGGTTQPQVVFHHSDFWVQGLNLGLTREF